MIYFNANQGLNGPCRAGYLQPAAGSCLRYWSIQIEYRPYGPHACGLYGKIGHFPTHSSLDSHFQHYFTLHDLIKMPNGCNLNWLQPFSYMILQAAPLEAACFSLWLFYCPFYLLSSFAARRFRFLKSLIVRDSNLAIAA